MLIKDYKTVKAGSIEELDVEVRKAIKSKKEWQPFGNIYYYIDIIDYKNYICQTMISYKNNS